MLYCATRRVAWSCESSAERGNHLVVHEPVRRDDLSFEVAELPAGLCHDRLDRGVVPQRELRVDGSIEGALGDEHVLPEIAKTPGMPGQGLEPRQVASMRARDARLAELPNGRDADR